METTIIQGLYRCVYIYIEGYCNYWRVVGIRAYDPYRMPSKYIRFFPTTTRGLGLRGNEGLGLLGF